MELQLKWIFSDSLYIYMTHETLDPRDAFLHPHSDKVLLSIYSVLALSYFIVISFFMPQGNSWLFALLISGEVFHLWQALTYAHTLWEIQAPHPLSLYREVSVDIFIPVYNEPISIVRETVLAAKNQQYTSHRVYILNDARAAGRPEWRAYERLAKELGVSCITRVKPGGAKAGNINHALAKTSGELVAIFDADHVPHADFLQKTVGYFADAKVAFVQSPQFYKNADTNFITGAAWEQQALFFGPICMGKNRLGAVTMCGTNMVIRRHMLAEVGGIDEHSIVEDFLTGLRLHAKGYRSVYVPEILAEGLAPEDLLSYYKQQFRWARGSLEVLFRYNPLFMKGLSWSIRVQYLAAAGFFLSGAVVLINALLPVLFLYTGASPLVVPTMLLATVFIPYIVTTVYVLSATSNGSFTFRAVAFSMSSFPIHLNALGATLLRLKNGFSVTSKTKLSGNFWNLAIPHIGYILLALGGVFVALERTPLNASVSSNLGWIIFTIAVLLPYIYVALRPGSAETQDTPALLRSRKVKAYAK